MDLIQNLSLGFGVALRIAALTQLLRRPRSGEREPQTRSTTALAEAAVLAGLVLAWGPFCSVLPARTSAVVLPGSAIKLMAFNTGSSGR